MEVVAAVGTAEAAVAAAGAERPDVCLLDLHMPGGGQHACRQIVRELPGTCVVMLSGSDEESDLMTAVRAGAVGYLTKDMDPARLPEAIVGAASGEAAIPRRLVARLVDEVRGTNTVGNVTRREVEVLRMLEKLPTREVAARLSISEVTVRRHARNAVQKLGVADRRAAMPLLTAS